MSDNYRLLLSQGIVIKYKKHVLIGEEILEYG